MPALSGVEGLDVGFGEFENEIGLDGLDQAMVTLLSKFTTRKGGFDMLTNAFLYALHLRSVKRAFRDEHGFTPLPGSNENEPEFNNIPDGEYQMTIGGMVDHVRVSDGVIYCQNFAF